MSNKFVWAPFSEAQLNSIENSDARLNFWERSVRPGKTLASIIRWIDYVKSGPPGELLMVGKTERTLKRNILDVIQNIVGARNYKFNRGTGEVYLYGRKVYVAGANDERAENKIRGMTLAGAYGDELTLWPQNFFKMLLTRLSVKGAKFFGTTNPDSPYHWLKEDYLDKTNLDMRRFSFKLDDNLSLDPDYVDSLKKEFSGVFYQRFIQGLWVIAEGLVYGEFNPKIMRISYDTMVNMIQEGKFKYYIAGVDWGYSHPMVGNIYGVTHDDRYYHIDEFYETERQTADLADWFLKKEATLLGEKIKYIFCDSAEPDRIVILKSKNLRATGANKAINSGLNSVKVTMKNKRFFISDRCANTLSEFGTYCYPEKDSKQAKKDLPVDENNHSMDATRYAIYNHELLVLAQSMRGKRKRRKRRGKI